MNRIEQLISQLCPDGVEFRELGEVLRNCENIKWTEQEDKKFKYIDLGSVDRTQHKIIEWTSINKDTAPSRAQQILKSGDVIFGTTRPLLKRYCLVSDVFDGQIASTGYCVLRANLEFILPNYIFHSIGTETFYDFVSANERGASYPAIPDNVVKQYKIPIPPIAIQNEIVKILDKFVELQAELQARRIQYNYYRNKLSTFPSSESEAIFPWLHKRLNQYCPEGVMFKALEDIFDLRNGYTPAKNNPSFWEGGTIPWFRMEDIRTNGQILDNSIQRVTESAIKGGQLFPANSILVATSATIGEHALITVPHLANQRFTCLSVKPGFNDVFNTKFIFYYCFVLNQWCCENTNSSSFASVDMQGFRRFKIPIIPMTIQQEIVVILDKFHALSNDLVTMGLPAEIKLRRIQYEYYRNQLLTFKEKPNNLETVID